MHLAKLHTPHGTALNEHYCRRWVSLTILKDLEKSKKKKVTTQKKYCVRRKYPNISTPTTIIL
jgi:hypothetical protein